MSTTQTSPPAPTSPDERTIVEPSLPRWAPLALVAVAAVASGLLTGLAVVGTIVLGALIYCAAIFVLAAVVENQRKALDRLVTGVVSSFFLIALVPLISVIWEVTRQGFPALNSTFFTASLRGVYGDVEGGVYHAIIGTLIITGVAALISVPIGIFTAIYLVEYGDNNRLSRQIRFFVDVMTGIPSIVAGLFAYALFALLFGPSVRMGVMGSIALAVLMIPVVVRSTEEMLKLVPNELREAAYALGVPKWRTVVKVVLPTALAGIATGVTLAIARVIGETAPLLIAVGVTDSLNFNPFDGRMATLPVVTYYEYTQPGVPPEFAIERAWGSALTLMIIVLVLNLAARIISIIFSPKKA